MRISPGSETRATMASVLKLPPVLSKRDRFLQRVGLGFIVFGTCLWLLVLVFSATFRLASLCVLSVTTNTYIAGASGGWRGLSSDGLRIGVTAMCAFSLMVASLATLLLVDHGSWERVAAIGAFPAVAVLCALGIHDWVRGDVATTPTGRQRS
jgi:hypothetical protein